MGAVKSGPALLIEHLEAQVKAVQLCSSVKLWKREIR